MPMKGPVRSAERRILRSLVVVVRALAGVAAGAPFETQWPLHMPGGVARPFSHGREENL